MYGGDVDCVLDIFDDCNQNGLDDTNGDTVVVEQAAMENDLRATMPRKRIGAIFFKTFIEQQQKDKQTNKNLL